MEAKHISLTEAEWTVMEFLWERQRCTGREAAEAMGKKMGWSRSTVLTFLRRLEGKGAVLSDAQTDPTTFCPASDRESAAVAEAEQLLERAYHGSLSLLVSALTRREALPQAEIDELYGLLEEMEGKRHD